MRRPVSDLNIYRIRVNPLSPHWDGAGHFMASTNFLDQMWLPDIQVPLPCTQQFLVPSSALDLHVQTVPQAADSHWRGWSDHIPEQAGPLHSLHRSRHRLPYEVCGLSSGSAALQISGKYFHIKESCLLTGWWDWKLYPRWHSNSLLWDLWSRPLQPEGAAVSHHGQSSSCRG